MSIKKAKNGKINIYVDADDTIIESSQAVIQIINEKYGINPPKTIEDLRDWNYTCIYPEMTGEIVEEIYSSEEFFERVKPNKEFLEVYRKHKDNFNFIVVTKGGKINLARKQAWFLRRFPAMKFVGFLFDEGGEHSFDKSSENMSGGIQIDDRTDALVNTNAGCKILLKNGREFKWNQVDRGYDLYIFNRWKEIGELLDFTLKYPEWITLMKESM